MCHCCRDGAELDKFDKEAMNQCTQEIFQLFKNEVYVLVLDQNGEPIWERASSPEFWQEKHEQIHQFNSAVRIGQQAVTQLMQALSIDQLRSFRLVCHSSRMFTFLLNETFRLIIFVRINGEYNEPDEKQISAICSRISELMTALREPSI